MTLRTWTRFSYAYLAFLGCATTWGCASGDDLSVDLDGLRDRADSAMPGDDNDGDDTEPCDKDREGVPCAIEGCSADGRYRCIGGTLLCEPADERCGNDVDDDCDDSVDEAPVGGCCRDRDCKDKDEVCQLEADDSTMGVCAVPEPEPEDSQPSPPKPDSQPAEDTMDAGTEPEPEPMIEPEPEPMTEPEPMPMCDDQGGASCAADMSVGVGACETDEGRLVCEGDALTPICKVTPKMGGVEVCGNATDDDCDGSADEAPDPAESMPAGLNCCETSDCEDPERQICNLKGEQGGVCEEACGNGELDANETCDTQGDSSPTITCLADCIAAGRTLFQPCDDTAIDNPCDEGQECVGGARVCVPTRTSAEACPTVEGVEHSFDQGWCLPVCVGGSPMACPPKLDSCYVSDLISEQAICSPSS